MSNPYGFQNPPPGYPENEIPLQTPISYTAVPPPAQPPWQDYPPVTEYSHPFIPPVNPQTLYAPPITFPPPSLQTYSSPNTYADQFDTLNYPNTSKQEKYNAGTYNTGKEKIRNEKSHSNLEHYTVLPAALDFSRPPPSFHKPLPHRTRVLHSLPKQTGNTQDKYRHKSEHSENKRNDHRSQSRYGEGKERIVEFRHRSEGCKSRSDESRSRTNDAKMRIDGDRSQRDDYRSRNDLEGRNVDRRLERNDHEDRNDDRRSQRTEGRNSDRRLERNDLEVRNVKSNDFEGRSDDRRLERNDCEGRGDEPKQSLYKEGERRETSSTSQFSRNREGSSRSSCYRGLSRDRKRLEGSSRYERSSKDRYSHGRDKRNSERKGFSVDRRMKERSGSPPRKRASLSFAGSSKINEDNISEGYSNLEDLCDNLDPNLDDVSDEDEPLSKRWYRSSPAEQYYSPVEGHSKVMESTSRGLKLAETFREKLIIRGQRARPAPGEEPVAPPRCHRAKVCKHKSEQHSSSSSSSGSESDEADHAMQELERKQQHKRRLHPEMWYNDPGEMNDGPLCRCSARTRRQGIRHGIYAGEVKPPPCDPHTNNADKLYHYRITISPPTNFLIKTLTVISHDSHEFLFSGFSLLSHYPLSQLPTCKVIRFNIEYTILYVEEQAPLNYTIQELELFEDFLFREILELVDLDMGSRTDSGCSQFHLLPRWERAVGGGGGEVLSVSQVLRHLLKAGGPLLPASALTSLRRTNEREWQAFVDGVRGMIVTYPGKKPCSVRVDQLDRSLPEDDTSDAKDKSKSKSKAAESASVYPEIVHFGIRPPQLSYAGNPEYKKAWRDYVKFRHLVANMPKRSYEDKRKLEAKEARLQEMRTQSKMKRDVTVAVSAEGFYRTGLMCDVVQHAMLIPVLISHLRFHRSLDQLERIIQHKFSNRCLLQLAVTHPSYRENFGTNPDHARNSLTNCGIRQPEYGDRRIHYMNIRKRGINTLINIMSRFGKKQETESAINHNERLEFLGDAVVEFLSSIHLFRMFPSLEEGGLATYRAAIVQNQHLAQLAKKLHLDQYMLYAHGSDLCHDLELRHAMANCFEALMGALFLDGGIDVADHTFALALWGDNPEMLETWARSRQHPLQEQEPLGDRRWVDQYPFLKKLTHLEESIGVEFTHIRLLARAFTDRSMGFTNLTLGSNQRLEFLGDTVLQLISSEHLYKHFPEHHEGHLSLLRSSLVNNRTQAVVCDDLAMAKYAVYHNPKAEPKTKDKADLLEAFLGALYIDKNIKYCHVFCSVTLFPRLREFIMNQEWNDPKSKLQQCCLTLRTMDGSEPDIPIYKVIECVGPTNTRVYTVAVYFRGERLASARGHCIQEAEMNSAKQAIANSQNLFPQLDHQKRVIANSMKIQKRKTQLRNENPREHESRSRDTGHSKRERNVSSSRRNDERMNKTSDSRSKEGKKATTRSERDVDRLPKAYMERKRSQADEQSVGYSSDSSHNMEVSSDYSISNTPSKSKNIMESVTPSRSKSPECKSVKKSKSSKKSKNRKECKISTVSNDSPMESMSRSRSGSPAPSTIQWLPLTKSKSTIEREISTDEFTEPGYLLNTDVNTKEALSPNSMENVSEDNQSDFDDFPEKVSEKSEGEISNDSDD